MYGAAEVVVSCSTDQSIISVPTDEHIIVIPPVDVVVPALRPNLVIEGGSVEDVVSPASIGDRLVLT